MKVFVVMSNDYPDKVFEYEGAAMRYCEKKMKEQGDPVLGGARIYYRFYPFELERKK